MDQPLSFGRTIGYYQSEGCDLQRSKDTVLVAESQSMNSGRVIGRVGAITLAAAAAVFVGTGNGVYTPAAPGPKAQDGKYVISCVEVTANSGKFEVTRPDGTSDGYFVAGVPKTTGDIRGTIADGAVDFDQTSEFSVVVSHTVNANDGQVVAWDPTATNGAQIAYGILYTPSFTDAGETKEAVAHVRDCRVWGQYVDFGAVNGAQKAAAIATLERKGLIVA